MASPKIERTVIIRPVQREQYLTLTEKAKKRRKKYMEKIIAQTAKLIPKAMAGDPFAIVILVSVGIAAVAQAIKENMASEGD